MSTAILGEYRERLAKLVTEKGIALEYSAGHRPGARHFRRKLKITLLPGQSPAEEFATLAHELAHELMHRDERRSNTSKRSRETEAEAVAFVITDAIGLETELSVPRLPFKDLRWRRKTPDGEP